MGRNKIRTLDNLEPIIKYKQVLRRNLIILISLFVVMVLFVVLSANAGSSTLTFAESFKALFGFGSKKAMIIVWDNRMPRVIGALVAGMGLSIAGAIMQTCLGNPLASPSTVGITSAATFGANIAIIGFGSGLTNSGVGNTITINNPYLTTLCAFICALIAVAIIMAISKFQRFSPEAIILAGAAISALCGAGTTLFQYFANEIQLSTAVFWTFGDLGRLSWIEILVMAIVTVACLIYFLTQPWNYNAMRSGEESAKSLGVNTKAVRIVGLVLASLLTAVIISFVGMIGFVGLIGPQIAKRIVGTDHRFSLPASALMGSVILLFADMISKVITKPTTLPVGAITAIIGAPIFIVILIRGVHKS